MAIDQDTLKAANTRAATRKAAGPTAVTARYDRRGGRVVVALSSGLEIAFKPHGAQGLEDDSADGHAMPVRWKRPETSLAFETLSPVLPAARPSA